MAGVDRMEAGVVTGSIRVEPLREAPWRRLDGDGLRREATERGCLFLRGLLPPSHVLALRGRVLEACRELGWVAEGAAYGAAVARMGASAGAYDAVWTDLQCRVAPLSEFTRLREHPAILRVLEAVFGGAVRAGRGDTCRVFAPGRPELTTLPHQDHHYVRGSTDLWTVWIPLGDCPRALGGLAVLPGSHREGALPHAGDGEGRQGVDVGPEVVWSAPDYRCGDVLAFNSLTLHRALENRTADRLRLSADFRYEPLQGVESAIG